MKQYAIYKGDKFLFIGTREECAKHFNVKKETVTWWATPTNYSKLTKDSNRLLAVIVDDEDE